MTNILGLDWGSKYIGLSIGSIEAGLARPFVTLNNDQRLIDKLKQIIADENISKITVGLPRNLEGQETAQSQHIREFANKLKQKLSIDISFQDETLTTANALTAQNQKKQKIDKDVMAAVIILQDYLDEIRR